MRESEDFRALATDWPGFDPASDKYARGVVGIMTGSARYPGAAVLTVLGALNSGAGFVRFAGADAARAAILARAPSVTYGEGRVDAWVVGSGWDEADSDGNRARWERVVADGVPVVADAGAMPFAADGIPAGSLLTPHAGELARLLGVGRDEVVADPGGSASRAARRFGATVLLKGHLQFVAGPHGGVRPVPAGRVWLAQAGSGDVLAGIAGTLLAQTRDAGRAAWLAGAVQAYLSSRYPGPYPPDRVAEMLPGFIGEFS